MLRKVFKVASLALVVFFIGSVSSVSKVQLPVTLVDQACAQATDCDPEPKYICSTEDGDKMDHRCDGCCEQEIRC